MPIVDINEYLKQLETLVNIDSGSHNPEGINRVADVIEGWYRDIGWHIKRHDLGPKTGRMIEICNRPSERYDVMFVGHMDTVFPDGTAADRPFRSDGTLVYGPGVSDMKNGDTAMFQIAKHLSPQALERLNICMAYNPDEEINSIYSKDRLDEIGAKSDRVFVMESCGSCNQHCFARKGAFIYDIAFHGKSAHAGFMFERECASAVQEMGIWITKLTALASREEDTTVNVGIARGGTARNVVPDYAEIIMEIRFKKDSEHDRIKKAVEEMFAAGASVPGVTVEVKFSHSTPPWVKTPESIANMERLEALADKLGIEFTQRDRGGMSDANHLAAVCPLCADGMGPSGGMDHSPAENGVIASIEPCVSLLCAFLEELAAEKAK